MDCSGRWRRARQVADACLRRRRCHTLGQSSRSARLEWLGSDGSGGRFCGAARHCRRGMEGARAMAPKQAECCLMRSRSVEIPDSDAFHTSVGKECASKARCNVGYQYIDCAGAGAANDNHRRTNITVIGETIALYPVHCGCERGMSGKRFTSGCARQV